MPTDKAAKNSGFKAKAGATEYVSQDERARRIAEGEKPENKNKEVPSNHNTLTEAKPLPLAVLQGKPDYNPMRAAGNKANDKTDVTLVPDTAKELVAEKGERPDAATVEYEGGTDMKGGELKGRKPAERSTDTVAVEGEEA
jgi:hypothetical protein